MQDHQTVMFFLDLALVVALARLLGAAARRLRQPPVIGEVIAGILLGPSLLGPAVSQALFPLDVRPLLTAMAGVGVAIFMMLIGLELDF